jgi:hypothetical protein
MAMGTPGEKTTEFWMAILVKVAVLVGALLGQIPWDTAAGAIAVTAGGYAVGRGLAKQGG